MSFSASWETADAVLPTLAFGSYQGLVKRDDGTRGCEEHRLYRPGAGGELTYDPPTVFGPGLCALSMLFSDWDRSGRRDLRVSNDRQYYRDGEEQLFRIEPGKAPRAYTHEDGWMPLRLWGMGIASQDLTGDGMPEVYLTSQGDNKLQTLANGPQQPTYEDIAFELGVTAHRPVIGDGALASTAWHPAFEDLNDDGFIDLYISKGNVEAQEGYALEDPSELFLGQPDGTFTHATEASGMVDMARARGAAVVDLDLDGRLDLVSVVRREPVRVWHNEGLADGRQAGHWLGVDLEQPGPNRDAIGAWLSREVRRPGGSARADRRRRARQRDAWPDPRRARDRDHGRGPGDLAGRDGGPVATHRGRPICDHPTRDGGGGDVGAVTARLAGVELPDFGRPATTPEVPAARYVERLASLRARMDERGYDRIVVYADREHSANLAWLTGFDPRFEEAILIVGPDGDPAVLVGNECVGMARSAPLAMRVILHQDLSLPSQPRHRSRPLTDELGDEGVSTGRRVGIVAWKTFAERSIHDAPAFLVDTVRGLVGDAGVVENATDLLIDPGDGLRTVNDVDTLAAMEAAAVTTSSGVLGLIRGLEPGMRERDAVALLGWDGSPLSCHLMLTAGERARLGLLSPGDRPIERGDPFTTAFGIWGSLTCRAGFVDGRRGRAAGRHPRLRRTSSSGRTSRRSPSGTRRSMSGRSAGRCRPSSIATSATRSSGSSSTPATRSRSTSGSTRRSGPARRSSCARGRRCRSTSSRRPGARGSRPTSRTPSRWPTPGSGRPSPRRIRMRGTGSRRDDRSWPRPWVSSSTPTSCRSRTSRPGCRRSCSIPGTRWSSLDRRPTRCSSSRPATRG